VRPDGGQLLGRRLLLDDDRHAPELLAERRWQSLEGVDDKIFDVRLGRFGGQHGAILGRAA
jgi:hypothetical protein